MKQIRIEDSVGCILSHDVTKSFQENLKEGYLKKVM